jgi:hypothetical protein
MKEDETRQCSTSYFRGEIRIAGLFTSIFTLRSFHSGVSGAIFEWKFLASTLRIGAKSGNA